MIDRQQDNIEILRYLIDEVEKHPELRFIQILWGLNIVDNSDRFYEESCITLNKIKRMIEEQNKVKKGQNYGKTESTQSKGI